MLYIKNNSEVIFKIVFVIVSLYQILYRKMRDTEMWGGYI